MNRSEIRPSRLWYWVAGVLAVLTVAGSVLIFTSGDEDLGSLTEVFGTLEELDVPGEVTVDLDAGDDWAIYRGSGSSEGTYFREGSLDCQVRDPEGDLVPLATDFGFSNVTLDGEVYITEYTFEVLQTGSYTVGCRGDGGPVGGETVLVGEKVEIGEIFGFFGRFAAGLAVLLLGLLICTAIALPVGLARSRKIGEAKRAGMLRG